MSKPSIAVPRSLPWILLVGGLIMAFTMTPRIGPDVADAEVPEGHQVVGFEVLGGFEWQPEGMAEVRSSGGMAGIPTKVQRLNGERVFIKGFMLPLESTEAGVTTFILNAQLDMCYFGAPTRPNDFVMIRMKAGEAARFTHRAVAVWGRLQVSAVVADGRITTLYRMDDAEASSETDEQGD